MSPLSKKRGHHDLRILRFERIFEIALSNSQVRYIIGDLDVKMFYLGLLRNCQSLSEKAMEVKAMLEG